MGASATPAFDASAGRPGAGAAPLVSQARAVSPARRRLRVRNIGRRRTVDAATVGRRSPASSEPGPDSDIDQSFWLGGHAEAQLRAPAMPPLQPAGIRPRRPVSRPTSSLVSRPSPTSVTPCPPPHVLGGACTRSGTEQTAQTLTSLSSHD